MTTPAKPIARFDDFTGPDGNIFAILGGCYKALKEHATPERLAEFQAEISAAQRDGNTDYFQMIERCLKYCEIVPEPPKRPTAKE